MQVKCEDIPIPLHVREEADALTPEQRDELRAVHLQLGEAGEHSAELQQSRVFEHRRVELAALTLDVRY